VGIAVDGSASNDGNDLLLEARMAMLLQRVEGGAPSFTVLEALELATTGMAGGAVHDPVAALLLCTAKGVDLSVINGRSVVRDRELVGVDLERAVARHNELAKGMADRHPLN
jgi:cytosine/adenosine deaminase-related metal-dependent hydrolase